MISIQPLADANTQLTGVIAVVGCDGTGKSTITADLLAYLQSKGPAERRYLGLISGEMGDKIKYLPLRSVSLTIENIRKADIAVIVTDHTDIDYKVVVENASQILDTRGVLNKFI